MIRTLICIALAAGAFFAWPQQARAAQSYDNCTGFITSLPATISTQGTWCLKQVVSTSMVFGDAITIATNNVTIDCNHFKIGGLAAGLGTTATGIRATGRLNVTVRNCNIRGFQRGIHFFAGGGHLIEDSSFDGNTYIGVRIQSAPGSTIRNNRVIDTGGSTSFAYGIFAEGGVDVINNTVNGVAPAGTKVDACGIFSTNNGDGSISGNRVRGLAPPGGGHAIGIYATGAIGGVISDNHVQGPGSGVTGSIGVRCDSSAATAHNNVILRFETAIQNCFSSANSVNPN